MNTWLFRFYALLKLKGGLDRNVVQQAKDRRYSSDGLKMDGRLTIIRVNSKYPCQFSKSLLRID